MASLAFPMQHQEANNWCWCAVSVSVDFFYNAASPWQQCLMAQIAPGAAGCCANPVPQPCDQPWYLEKALQTVNRLKGQPINGTLSFPRIQTILAAGAPVCCRIVWYTGGAHFVVISGCQQQGAQQTLSVEDPFFGSSTQVDYNTFCTGYHYGQGYWSDTYLV